MDERTQIPCPVLSILVTLSLVALGACQERPRPGYQLLDLSKLHPLDTALERARWERVPSEMRDNLFLPETYQPSRTEEDKRRMIADFYLFSNARAAVLQGRAPNHQRRAYYATYINQLEQREAILRHLITSTDIHVAIATGRVRAGLLARKEKAEREQEYVQQANQRLSREVQGSGKREAPQRPRVICVVTAEALVLCIQEAKLAQYFMGGHWTQASEWVTDRFDPARGHQLLYQLDRIIDRFELHPRSNTFVRCANGAWFSLDTQGPDIALAAIAGPTDVNLPSVAEMAGMQAGCEVLTQYGISGATPGSGGGLGGVDSHWVPKVIGLVNEAMKECAEGPGGGVEAGGGGGMRRVLKDFGLAALGPYAFFTSGIGTALLGMIALNVTDYPKPEVAETRAAMSHAAATEAYWEAEAWEAYAQQQEAEADYAQTVAANSEDAAAKDPESEEKRQQAEEDRRAAEQARKGAEEARQEAERKKQEAEEKEKKAEEDSKAADKEAGKETGSYDPDGNYSSSCDGAWDSFKARCDQTNGWDRPGDKCNDFLRRMAGCVDTREIYPTPDGDNTCTRGSSLNIGDVAEAACRERQKYMSTVEPGDLNCFSARRGVGLWPIPNLADVCSDPAARPLEGQCGDSPVPVPVVEPVWSGGPQPKPFRDVGIQDGVQVFDGLMLDGLGFGWARWR